MSSLDNLVNSQRVYSQQIQKDVFTSNVGVNIDPVAVYPKPENNAIPSTFFQSRFEAKQSGNLVAEDNLPDLNLANLTVGGEIRVPIVRADDIILNGGSLANEIFQGFLTTPLQVDIDANGKNITGASNIGVSRVDTSLIFGAAGTGTGGAGGLMSIRPNGIPPPAGTTAQTLKIGDAGFAGDVIIETGGDIGGLGGPSGNLTLRCNQNNVVQSSQYNINIGDSMGQQTTATAIKFQTINIGTVDSSGGGLVNNIAIGNNGSANLQFFSASNIISMSSGGTTPDLQEADTIPGAGTKLALENLAGNVNTADNSTAIEIIARILEAYGLINA